MPRTLRKSAIWKFYDLKRMEFWADFGAEDEDRLSPFKNDKLKDAEIPSFKAGSDYSLSAKLE